MSDERIFRGTAEEIRKLKGETDWARLRAEEAAGIEPELDEDGAGAQAVGDAAARPQGARLLQGRGAGLPDPHQRRAARLCRGAGAQARPLRGRPRAGGGGGRGRLRLPRQPFLNLSLLHRFAGASGPATLRRDSPGPVAPRGPSAPSPALCLGRPGCAGLPGPLTGAAPAGAAGRMGHIGPPSPARRTAAAPGAEDPARRQAGRLSTVRLPLV